MTNSFEGVIKLSITHLDIEESNECYKDNLTIYEGIYLALCVLLFLNAKLVNVGITVTIVSDLLRI